MVPFSILQENDLELNRNGAKKSGGATLLLISFGGFFFFPVGGVCPVDRRPFSLRIFFIETVELVKEVLLDIVREEPIHGDQVGLLCVQRAPIA